MSAMELMESMESMETVEAKKNLNVLLANLKSRRMKYQKRKSSKQYISAWLEDELLFDRPDHGKIKALVIVLRTKGCSWANGTLKPGWNGAQSGCTMCGYINDCLLKGQSVSNEDIVYQFKSALEKFNNEKFELIKIFTSGSFMDDSEVPPESQADIIKIVNELNVNNLLVETRPEFVTDDKLNEFQKLFAGKLQIALGLESSNDKILKYSINKGFKFLDYINAVKIIQNFNIFIKTYLLLKPPFLTEHDAIIDVINSIQVLSSNELSNTISINPINIQNFTIVEYLYHRNEYRPPWLWSVVEVLKEGKKIINESGNAIRLMSQPTAAGHSRGAHNCFKCNNTVIQALKEFSLVNDINIFTKLSCDCMAQWRDLLELENIAKS